MANALYTLAKKAFLDGGINWASDTISAALVSSSYTPNLATDQYWSTAVANIVGSKVTLASKTDTGGAAGCATITFTAVPGTTTINYLAIFKDTGNNATSPLIALYDTASGLPITSNGSDIVVTISTTLFTL